MKLTIVIMVILVIDLASVWLYRRTEAANELFIAWITLFHGLAAYLGAVYLGVPYDHPVSLYLILPSSIVGFQSARVVVRINRLEKRNG